MRGKKCEILVKTDKNTRHKHRPQQQMNKHEYQVNVNITKFSTKREINYRNGSFLTVTPTTAPRGNDRACRCPPRSHTRTKERGRNWAHKVR